MKRILSTVHHGLSIVIIIGLIGEFFFAGMGVFHASSFQIHRMTGVLLWAGSALLLLLALIGRLGRRTIGFSTLLFVLLLIQPLLLQISQPYVKALHLVNGLAVLASCSYPVFVGAMRIKEQK